MGRSRRIDLLTGELALTERNQAWWEDSCSDACRMESQAKTASHRGHQQHDVPGSAGWGPRAPCILGWISKHAADLAFVL
jgi:hypothetical protein